MIRPALAALGFLLVADAGLPDFERHFAPTEDLEAIDVAELDRAGDSVDMAAYVLTDIPVIEALTLAAERGAKVRIYRQREEFRPRGAVAAAIERLAAAGARVRFKPPGALMHMKAYCVDGATLRIGAANFSESGLKEQDNDLELDRRANACVAFERDFERMWGKP